MRGRVKWAWCLAASGSVFPFLFLVHCAPRPENVLSPECALTGGVLDHVTALLGECISYVAKSVCTAQGISLGFNPSTCLFHNSYHTFFCLWSLYM